MNEAEVRSEGMPDFYDRQLGLLTDLSGTGDCVKTKPSTVQDIPTMSVGGTRIFIVQTFRQREKGDTVFLSVATKDGMVRLVIPPKVTASIARQREALTTKVRSKIAKATAEDLKARGIKPGFMRPGTGKKKAAK